MKPGLKDGQALGGHWGQVGERKRRCRKGKASRRNKGAMEGGK